jgi:hypothetical protein
MIRPRWSGDPGHPVGTSRLSTLRRLPGGAGLLAVALLITSAMAACGPATSLPPSSPLATASPGGTGSGGVGTPGTPAAGSGGAVSGALPSASPSSAPSAPPAEEPIHVAPFRIPREIQLYPDAPSVLPGEPLGLHVSTEAARYDLAVYRVGPGGLALGTPVWSRRGLTGHAYWRLYTVDPVTLAARAEWPVAVRLPTSGWTPGVYVVRAVDSRGSVGWTIFVVRSPTFRSDRPTFVLPVLTYQAYNAWGGADFYTHPRAVEVSFLRPYLSYDGVNGLGLFPRSDVHLLAWLSRHGYDLDFTTDYDLAMAPPPVAPPLLIIPMHMEYVPASLRNWIEDHVNGQGDMNLALFGANSIFWQARLVAGPGPGPDELVCYKTRDDPIAASDPAATTVRWRQPPVNRPEGVIFGSQFTDILGDGFTSRFDYVVDPTAPLELLAGTGWHPGTIIRGILVGEGDAIYPGVGAISVMTGLAENRFFRPMTTNVVVRVSPAGARVFSVGSFQWTDGFIADRIGLDLGVSMASFDRFNRNVLAWLGFPAPR